MRFTATSVSDVVLVELEPLTDERGFFARTWCREEFASHGLNPDIAQCSVSFNARKGTLRGLHYQVAPHQEAKLVRCTSGAVFDVAVDLRPGSPTYLKWVGIELTARNRRALYIPEGCAHGFITLADDTEVLYQITPAFVAGFGTGVRWNDPAFGIIWPAEPEVISERDRTYPDYRLP